MDKTVVTIEKLVHGGQGLGTLPDGRKVFVWNTLPGEEVEIRIIKKRRDYAEAIAVEVITPSEQRIEPQEQNYLSTSPWQIMTYKAENIYKHDILKEIFSREHISLPDFAFIAPSEQWHYRNKMEYSFWGDDDGLHLALHQRGSQNKQIIDGSMLAMGAIDIAANNVLKELKKHNVRAGGLKTVILRCDQKGNAAASLFVKNEDFIQLSLPDSLKGMRVYYSNPKSPASIPSRLMYELGSSVLTDTLKNRSFGYDVDSFFQVNLPIFEDVLTRIAQYVDGSSLVDMYGGVGVIGLSVGGINSTIVELDPHTAAMAKVNAQKYDVNVIETSTEKVLELIESEKIVVVDPPRAGLHRKVIERFLEVKPPKIVYLSCNPVTQARDIAPLLEDYKLVFFEGYNFFPHTPHIESLAILQRVD